MTGHVAEPQACANGCQTGHGADRTPVYCEGRARICPRCVDRLDTWLRQIPDCYAILPRVVHHGSVALNPESMHIKCPDPPAPYRLEVRDLLDDRRGTHRDGRPADDYRGVYGLLRAWATWVKELRHVHGGGGVARDCALLGTHLAWVTEQEWVGELCAELRELVRVLMVAVGDYRPTPVGVCFALVRHPRLNIKAICGGDLYRDQTGHGVHCASCGDRTDPRRLRDLGRRVGIIADDEAS